MTTIHLYRHPFAEAPAEVIEADSLAAWLIARIKQSPARLLRRIYRGALSAGVDISRDVPALMAGDAPYYTVQELPGTGAEAFQVFQIILAAYSVASAFMASKPDMPSNVNRSQESPNNSLGVRENQLRMMERVEDIFGTVPAVASIAMQTYTKYLNNVQYEYGYYCISRGYLDVSDIVDGDTAIGFITGASVAVYPPFTSPNSGSPQLTIGPAIIDTIVTVRRSSEVDGITLKAANQLQLEVSISAGYYLLQPGPARTIGATTVPASSNDRIVQFFKRPNFNAVCTAGQTIGITSPDRTSSVTGAVAADGTSNAFIDTMGAALFAALLVGTTITVSGFAISGNNGTFTVVSKPDPAVIIVSGGALTDEPGVVATIDVFQSGAPWSGTRTIAEVGDGYLILNSAVFPAERNDPPFGGPNTVVVANNGLVDWTDWVIVPTPGRSEIWTNVLAAQGMYKDDGGRSSTSVAYQMQIEQLSSGLVPTGYVQTAYGSISGVTTDECAETLEVATDWQGPARVRMRRTTPYDYYFGGNVVDEIKWRDLSGVNPVDRAHFGNVTTIHSVTPATQRSTAVKSRQLKCLASRRIPKWTGSGFTGGFDSEGRHTWGTIHASSFMHEIIACIALDPTIGNRPESDLDMVQMSSVVDQLYAIHPEAPTFNYTFDTDGMSFEETIETVANACFCNAFRQSGKIRLGLDRRQDYSFTLFNHRSKDPDYAESLTRTFRNDADYDAVEFIYQDPGTEQAETIRLPLDGSGTKFKKLEIPGIRSFAQAWLRANREYRKLLGQRLTIETRCTTDARALLPNVRIDVVDNTRFQSFDGEVVGVSGDGLTLTLSQRVAFTSGEPHSIVLRRSDGSLQAITVTEVAGRTDQVRLAELPTEAVKTETDRDGVATIFSFAADTRRGAQAFLFKDADAPKDNYMVVRGVNYSATYYEMDTQPIPPRDSVIN